MFSHLNIHSIYSKMKGLLSIEEIIKYIGNNRMDSVALTDVNGIWGFINFVKECNLNNISPIAGVNLITKRDDVVLLAENQDGYKNICRLISIVHKNPTKSIVEDLKQHSKGIFILSSNYHVIKGLKNNVLDTHLFFELRAGLDERVSHNIAKDFNIEMVATNNSYFRSKEHFLSYKILRAISSNKKLKDIAGSKNKAKYLWLRNEFEMIELFPNSMDAINNSYYLSQRCKKNWSFINTIFPGLSLKNNYQSNYKLRMMVYNGAKKRYHKVNSIVEKRIEYELNLIIQKGFSPYFLVVYDIVKKTKATIGRGSAAASIVSYCLFITQVDPLKYNLKFERFIHPDRKDMPDIDVDFPWDERDDIIKYVFKKYGLDRTAMVSNHVFLKPKSAIREVSKVYGLSNEEINSITKQIVLSRKNKNLSQLIKRNSQFNNLNLEQTIQTVLKQSNKVVGALRYLSVHPGGVVIVPDKIQNYVPVLDAPKGIQITQWEKDQVEYSGLLKIDLLGNRSLAVVRDTIKQINIYSKNSSKDKRYINYHQIQPIGDKKTEELMKQGKTIGVFYIESPATRQLMQKGRNVNFEHIVIYSSIIRPAANKFTNLIIERINGEKWKLVHPDLHFLEESYGIIVYEEQVSLTVKTLAGLSYSDSEKLRKDIGRDNKKKVIYWENIFAVNSLNRGYSQEVITKVWLMISSFVGYSFCKPHSASYAMLSFTCAYLKAHFTSSFMASVISNQGGYYSNYAYMGEAKRFGVEILKPDINFSLYEWFGYDMKIQMGFMSIKNLKKKTSILILEERKVASFVSLNDFFERVELNFADVMLITNAGCFAKLLPTINHREIAYRVAFFYLGLNNKSTYLGPVIKEGLNVTQKYKMEVEAFGYPISIHPMEYYRPILSSKINKAIDIKKYSGKYIYLIGILITKKETQTKNRERMEFLTLEDETDIYDCVLFPDVFKKFDYLLSWEDSFIIRGLVNDSYGLHSIIIEKIASINQ